MDIGSVVADSETVYVHDAGCADLWSDVKHLCDEFVEPSHCEIIVATPPKFSNTVFNTLS